MNMYSSSNQSDKHLPLPHEVREALDRESRQYSNELERVWNLTGVALAGNNATPPEEIDEMWSRIKSSLDKPSRVSSASLKQRNIRSDRPPLRTARTSPRISMKWMVPALTMTIMVGLFLYWMIPVTVTADRGEMAEAILPDGSVISLNSGSSLSYKRGFDGIPFRVNTVRSVKLEGEGFFEVAHSDVSFTVETFNAQVQVLGTKFNVRSWPAEPEHESTISLISGKVSVAASNDLERKILLEEPGHTVIVRSSDVLPEAPELLDVNSVLSWQERGLLIKSKTLVTVFSELERRYDITISVEDTKILNDSLTMLFAKPESIESILSGICVEKNLKFRRTSRGYLIYRSDM